MAWGEFQPAESMWRGVGQLPGMHTATSTSAETDVIYIVLTKYLSIFCQNMMCTTTTTTTTTTIAGTRLKIILITNELSLAHSARCRTRHRERFQFSDPFVIRNMQR
jgi:hypothetical protein